MRVVKEVILGGDIRYTIRIQEEAEELYVQLHFGEQSANWKDGPYETLELATDRLKLVAREVQELGLLA